MNIRRRHKPNCAKKKDAAKRCSCDGPWQARIPDPERPGRRIEKTFPAGRKDEAIAWYMEQETSKRNGGWISPRVAERPFGDVLATGRVVVEQAEPNDGRAVPDDRRELPAAGVRRGAIGRITHEWVQRYIDRLATSRRTPGTVRGIYSVLRNAMSRASGSAW